MTNKKEKDLNPKERILAFKLSQEFTEEDLKQISGAANGKSTTGVGGTNHGSYNHQTGQTVQDTSSDITKYF